MLHNFHIDTSSPSYGQGIIHNWEVFSSPAPLLEIFTVSASDYFGYGEIRYQNSRPLMLFGNDAPSLHIFTLVGTSIDPFNKWLSNLRSLTLSHPFQFPQMYAIISALRKIESLRVVDYRSQENDFHHLPSTFPPLVLPNLTELTLNGEYTIISPLMSSITFRDDCILHLTVDTPKRWVTRPSSVTLEDKERVESVQLKAAHYLQRYLLSHRTEELSIHCRNDYIHLSHPAGFTIDGAFNQGSGPKIIEQISRAEYLSSLTRLTLQLDIAQIYSSSLSALPSVLTSLSVLETDEDTLRYFIDNVGGRIFPCLRALRLTPLKAKSLNNIHHLWEFLNQQFNAGSPVSILDLTRLRPSQVYSIETYYIGSEVGRAKMKWILPHRVPMLGQLQESGKSTVFRSGKADLLRQEIQRVDIDETEDFFFRHYEQSYH